MWSKTIDFGPRTLASLPATPPSPSESVAQVDYFDRSTPGLYLRVSSTGVRTWALMARVGPKGARTLRRFTIGRAPQKGGGPGVSLAEARHAAFELKRKIQSGVDPQAERRAADAARLAASQNTFAAVVDRFLVEYPRTKTKHPLRPSTLDQYRSFLKRGDFAVLNDRAVTSITQADISGVLKRIQKRGAMVRSNRALASIGKLFRWLAAEGEITVIPTLNMKPSVQEVPRKRHLFGNVETGKPSEIALMWRAGDQCGPVHGPFLKVLMLTGARVDEVAWMQWDHLLDLDGDNPRWLIPADRAKNWREHVVPLTPLAVRAIKSVPRIEGSKYVFAFTGKKPIQVGTQLHVKVETAIDSVRATDSKRYKGQLDEAAGRWWFHDFRRTVKTGLKELGFPKEVRDALLNHAPQGVDEHYDHAAMARQKRDAAAAWERHVRECLTPVLARANVVALRKMG